jgi:REP element-mobilizing transposase RayT
MLLVPFSWTAPFMPFIRIWIHVVWSTKYRESVLLRDGRQRLFEHIRQYARHKGIHLDFINGHLEHVHALVSIGSDQTTGKVAQLMKGESSHWANQQSLFPFKIEWQDEYFGVSVDHSDLGEVRMYIANQEEHHRTKSFSEEYDELLQKYGFDALRRG